MIKNISVGLFTSVYFNNIGNGFIDLGAEATLKQALPENYNLIKVSQCANFAASMSTSFSLKENPVINWLWIHTMQKFAKKLHDRSYKMINSLNVISVPKIIKFDYLIIPGCVLTVPFFTIYGSLLQEKTAQGCKLIFLGASGNFYTDYEAKIVSEYLKKLKPLAIITRDTVAYEKYAKYAKYDYNGIDNAFFLNLLDLPNVDTNPDNYVVVNLEEPKHRKIKTELIKKLVGQRKNIICTNHKPYPYSKVSKAVKDNIIISDYPLDYLILYKNASKVYSDRVHACISTLSFGNEAVLYSDTPRKTLFNNVGIEKIDALPMNIQNLQELQNSQIRFLKKIFVNEQPEEHS